MRDSALHDAVIADIENWLIIDEMEASWHSPIND